MPTWGAKAAALLALTVTGAVSVLPGTAAADEIRASQRPLLSALNVETAWKTTRGRGVTVAVVDSGVDPRQADLAGSVTTGPNMIAFVDRGSRPTRSHGTSMASLIAGHGHGPGRRDGVIGVAPQARILAIRAIADPEDASFPIYRASERAEEGLPRAIRYAADHGADVINLSLGRYEENPDERAAIAHAISKGVVVVAAAGNEGDERRRLDRDGFTDYSYPAAYPGVIAVAATGSDHRRTEFSNRNYSVLVSAPGSEITMAGPGETYYRGDGTSQASALVSGIAALIRSRHPKLPPTLVAQSIIAGTRYGPSGKYSPEVGFGEVNAARALAAADTLTKTRPRPGASGRPAGQPFAAGEQGPVKVIERPLWITVVIAVVIAVGVAGLVAAGFIALTLHRRHPRRLQPGFAALSPAGGGGQMATGPPVYRPEPPYWRRPPDLDPAPGSAQRPHPYTPGRDGAGGRPEMRPPDMAEPPESRDPQWPPPRPRWPDGH